RRNMIAEIGRLKRESGTFLRDLAREEELLAAVVEEGRDLGLDGYFITQVFREILEYSVRIQRDALVHEQNPALAGGELRFVGFQGSEGAYSHLAGQKYFASDGDRILFRGYSTFRELLEAVVDRAVACAVLPIENTTAGSINESYDLLSQMELSIVGEEVFAVEHCLFGLEEVPLSRIRRIYSHPQALAQCSDFLAVLTHCTAEGFLDTAMAVRKVKEDEDLSQAAIASEEAGRLLGLKLLRRGISNQRDNYTRFVIVSRETVAYDERIPCKTSLVFATRHEPGALVRCLNVLQAHGLNMTKLESRPRPSVPFDYLFYVDFEGNIANADVRDAVQEITREASFLKCLGSYPARTGPEARPSSPRRVSREKAAPAAPQPPPEAVEKKPYRLASRGAKPEDTVIPIGSVLVGGRDAVVIAGPCSVESSEQILQCARIVRETGGDILRGGCFKPRTSPYSFQGLGYEGLDHLARAGREFGLPVITEVLNPADVVAVSRVADILQIGARNAQNFSLLKEVGRVDRPVLLKRGMMTSLDEFLAAAEYILSQGNQRVILCERGIRTFETATRNTLDLSAVPVLRERTHLPIIVDPSHACGVARWVTPLAEAALACGAHGIMVEIHPQPEKALSDGPQSLTFADFSVLMQRIGRASSPPAAAPHDPRAGGRESHPKPSPPGRSV
ncbi:MAG TPA: 3-deoxy-7-phosphoheptulonate synthase, partial [Thermoanaerobaculia bacterium]|nr:3-deoxy-7-phosphoheptulonate synthase [Thermoanaerobaculia bacterium]